MMNQALSGIRMCYVASLDAGEDDCGPEDRWPESRDSV